MLPLGIIPTDEALISGITNLPEFACSSIPMHERPYAIEAVRSFSVPDEASVALARALDRMLRSACMARHPASPATARLLYSSYDAALPGEQQPRGMFVQGLSGVGKTTALQRSLSRYPQCYEHREFPAFVGGLRQLVWLHIDVPATGKLKDLATSLIFATAAALDLDSDYIDRVMAGRRTGTELFRAWSQLAKAHFLGVLVLDEAQNIFRLTALNERKSPKSDHLRVAEDALLKELLLFINSSQVAVVLSGTPDAAALLSRRMSIAQRLTSYGYHELDPFSGPDDIAFKAHFLPALLRFQFAEPRLGNSEELRTLLYQATAGIRRLIRMIWESAHVIAARQEEQLDLPHIKSAINQSGGTIQPAVRALLSGDPVRLREYEDLLRRL
jgi:hypothetical protein